MCEGEIDVRSCGGVWNAVRQCGCMCERVHVCICVCVRESICTIVCMVVCGWVRLTDHCKLAFDVRFCLDFTMFTVKMGRKVKTCVRVCVYAYVCVYDCVCDGSL